MIAPLDDSQGIELRDWFAGLAMHAMMENSEVLLSCQKQSNDENVPVQQIVAETAYTQADHMLAAAVAELTEGEPEEN